uniref:Uncharacterized protein n=1 Tax=Panagrolaimus superbus TaxID=310955 RepID=A0A914YH62_9BILA
MVTKFISFSSNILVNGISDLDNRYFSLFGSFPSNSVGRPLNSSVLIKSDEEMLEENENKENKEKDVENVFQQQLKIVKII